METLSIPFLIVFSVGTLNGCFLAFYFFVKPGDKKIADTWLGILLLVFTLRISKLVIVYFYPLSHPIFDTLWYTGLASTGLLLFFYLSSLRSGPRNRNHVLVHMLPLLIYQLFQMFSPWKLGGMLTYQISVFYLVIYLLFSGVRGISLYRAQRFKLARRWLSGLFLFFGIESALLLLFLIVRYRFLHTEGVVYNVFIYAFVFVELRWKIIQKLHRATLWDTESDSVIRDQLIHLMENEKMYLFPDLKVGGLAASLGCSPHKLSQVMTSQFGQNFNDFINSYRIEEVKRRLSIGETRNKTIASLAFDCGFNSLSVFNSAFKKFTGMTPSQFVSSR